MRAGKLKYVITFLEGVETTSAGNVPGIRWTRRGQAFAEKKTRDERSMREANQFYERQVTEFFVRFFEAINVQDDWYVECDGMRYRITGIYPDYDKSNFTKIKTEFFNETSRS